MAKAFIDACSRELDIHEILRRILAEAGPGYMNTVTLKRFE